MSGSLLAKAAELALFETRLEPTRMEHLFCGVMPVPRREIDASCFGSLHTLLNGDNEVSCAPESNRPLLDYRLTITPFAVIDGV